MQIANIVKRALPASYDQRFPELEFSLQPSIVASLTTIETMSR